MISDLIHRHGSHSGDFLQVLHQNGLQIRNVPAIFRQEASRVVKRPSRLNSCCVWPSDWLSGSMWCNGSRRVDLFSIYVSRTEKNKFEFELTFLGAPVKQLYFGHCQLQMMKKYHFIFKLRSKSSWDKINTYFTGMQIFNVVASKVEPQYQRFFKWTEKYFRHPLVKSVFFK